MIFLSYHFAGTFFKNSAEDGSITPFMGTTLPPIVLFGLSLIITWRARADKGIFGFSNFISKFMELWDILLRQASSVQRIFAKN